MEKQKMKLKEKVDMFFTNNVAKICCYVTDIFFLAIHIFYLVFFILHGTKIMIYVSIASVTIYSLLFIVILLHKMYLYINIVYYEVMAFFLTFLVLFGWGYGIEIMLMGFSICIFTAGYLSEKMMKKRFFPVIRSVISAIICLFFAVAQRFYTPMYATGVITDTEKIYLTLLHTLITCLLGVMLLYLMTNHAKNLEDQIYKDSITDRLTGIYNRRGFLENFEKIPKEDYNQYVMTIFDIDDFKKFNDTYGHRCGDAVLKSLSVYLGSYVDQTRDLYCRWGGEEFVILTRIRNTSEFTRGYMDEFRELIDSVVFKFNDLNLHVSVTQGCKVYNNYPSAEAWIDAADNNLYIGKNSGKNKTVMD